MNYLKIDKTSVANGTGVRVVLWVAGCTMNCKGCFNPETWCFNSGKPFDEDAKQQIFDMLDKPYIKGITLSGGHPFEEENIYDVYNLIKEIKLRYPDKDIWAYSGYTYKYLNEHLSIDILKYIDVLVDGSFVESKKDVTLAFRGSKNQCIVNVQESLRQGTLVLYCD